MKKIEAKIVADSVSPQGHRITSMLLTYPRFIHSELMTHRMFSRNSASSRAIPFEKMVQMVQEDPFIPLAWQKSHKGMQGMEYITNIGHIEECTKDWLEAKNNMVKCAKRLNGGFPVFEDGKIVNYNDLVTKQLCNRLFEPFMWHTVLVTATEWENFFELRAPKYKLIGLGGGPAKSRKEWLKRMQFSSALHPSQYPKTEEEWWMLSESSAEIHIQALAEAMWDAMSESIPKELKAGEWHIPFGDKISNGELRDYFYNVKNNPDPSFTAYQETKLKASTARCARLSYMTFDGEIDYEKDIKLHDHLLESKHMSPFEHCARVMSDDEYYSFIKSEYPIIKEDDGEIVNRELYPQACGNYNYLYGWCNNFRGWVHYRYLVENT